MRDGSTRKHIAPGTGGGRGIETFLVGSQAKVVVVSGSDAGAEFSIERDRLTLGRGPGVDLPFNDPAMSRQHAVIEYTSDGFRIQDLGSTNGILLNGNSVQVGEIGHGDRFEIGGQVFQLVIQERDDTPNTYELSSEV